jgi:hypothetical protein
LSVQEALGSWPMPDGVGAGDGGGDVGDEKHEMQGAGELDVGADGTGAGGGGAGAGGGGLGAGTAGRSSMGGPGTGRPFSQSPAWGAPLLITRNDHAII